MYAEKMAYRMQSTITENPSMVAWRLRHQSTKESSMMRMRAGAALDNTAREKAPPPVDKRETVDYLISEHGLNVRRSCKA